MTTARRSTPRLSTLRRAIRRIVFGNVFARLVLGAVLLLASPSSHSIVGELLDLAGIACCDDEGESGLGDCCPEGDSHCARCVHLPAGVPEPLAALEAPFVLEVRYEVSVQAAPPALFGAPPFRPPSA